MNDFIAVFVLWEYETGNIKYCNKEFYGNYNDYPLPNSWDTRKLISLVKEDFNFLGYDPIDVCLIIDIENGKEVWGDIEDE